MTGGIRIAQGTQCIGTVVDPGVLVLPAVAVHAEGGVPAGVDSASPR